MNEIIENNIENLIYEIRGKQVMLDRDLAFLYDVETRILIQKVKRNIERFPSEFFFQMSNDEFKKIYFGAYSFKEDEEGYEIKKAEKEDYGTEIKLHIKKKTKEKNNGETIFIIY